MGWRAILITLVLAGCAASGPSGPSRPAAPGLTPEQRQRLVDAERLYRSRSEEFVSVRDELLGHHGQHGNHLHICGWRGCWPQMESDGGGSDERAVVSRALTGVGSGLGIRKQENDTFLKQ